MKYIKKPVIVDAFQLDDYGYNIEEWFWDAVCDGDIIIHGLLDKFYCDPIWCEIKTHEGTMRANTGDYIIKGVKGEIYPCKADIFEETYEVVNMVNKLNSNADAEETMSCKQDNDPVNHPSHYTQGGKEVIEIIQEVCSIDEFIGYCKGNVLKYLARRNFKGFYKQDLQKADWYLDYLLNCALVHSPAYRAHTDSSIRQNLPDTVLDSCKKSFNVEWYVADAYMFALQNDWANASRSLKIALEMIEED